MKQPQVSHSTRSQGLPTNLLAYGVALLSVILALGINLLFRSYLEPTPTPPFFIAIIVSIWCGGLGPGLLTTVLSTLAINYLYIEPIYSLNAVDPGSVLRLSLFVIAALLINSMHQTQRSTQQRAETNFQSLRDSEARFTRLAESNIIGMVVADLQGVILEANDLFLQIVGYTQEELRSGRLCWREITPPEFFEANNRAVEELLTTGACIPFEKEYIRKDGSRISVLHGAAMTGEMIVTGFVLDLSQRKQAEAAQQEAIHRERSLYVKVQAVNAQLETVLRSIDDQFLVLDQEWRYVYVSDRVVEVVGKSREELLGQCIWELFPETVESEFYLNLHRAVAAQEIMDFEYFYAPWQRWFENRVYPSANGVSILVTDVTDRKWAEDSLQRTNQTLQTLLNACPVAIAFFDPQGIVRLWNRAAEHIFGWSAAEAIGQFMPTVPHRSQAFLASIQTVLSGRSLDGLEAQHQRKDGRMVDLEIWANLAHDAQGNPGCLGIAWDITERKQTEAALRQSEERYRYLAELIPQLVWTANAEGMLLDVNQRWLDFTGLPLEQVQIGGWQAIVHPDDVPVLSQQWVAAQHNGIHYQAEGRMQRADGAYRWHLHQAVPLKTEQGEILRWFGTATDIEEQKQLQQERDRLLKQEQAARAEAEMANRIKDEFLAVLSHELRSPLNPILGWSRLLQTQKFDAQKTQEALATIERNARLQTQLIEDLLDVSRILRGKLVLNTEPVNLPTTIAAALETVRLAAEAKNIQIHSTVAPNVGLVLGDVTRLQQVMWNLLSNAIKFTPIEGRVEVRLEVGEANGEFGEDREEAATQLSSPRPYAQITVTDTGKGINPDFLPYVFDYFRQEDGTTTRRFSGLGLGLAIVRHITELHGGIVWAESPGEGMGATFTVQLPLMTIAVKPSPKVEASPSPNLSGLSVLAVDDDADIRELMEFILVEAGAEVRVAASATEALQQLKEFSPEVLVSDIGMPDVDGYVLMQQVRNLSSEGGKTVKGIALTAYASELDQKQAFAAGFQLHLAKPVEPEQLISAIARLVDRPNPSSPFSAPFP